MNPETSERGVLLEAKVEEDGVCCAEGISTDSASSTLLDACSTEDVLSFEEDKCSLAVWALDSADVKQI